MPVSHSTLQDDDLQLRAARRPGAGEFIDPAADAVVLSLPFLGPVRAIGAHGFAQTRDK